MRVEFCTWLLAKFSVNAGSETREQGRLFQVTDRQKDRLGVCESIRDFKTRGEKVRSGKSDGDR